MYRKSLFLILLFSLLSNLYLFADDNCLIVPKPKSFVSLDGEFKLETAEKVYINDSKLLRQFDFLADIVGKKFGIRLNEGGKKSDIRILLDPSFAHEEYELMVSEADIVVKGSETGCFYGIISLLQMMDNAQNGILPACHVKDSPRFGYRGFMLDTARYFYDVDYIREILDLMAYYKLNVFHWHLTDDQGWRIEIKAYPELTKAGAWRNSTQIHRNKTQDYIPNGGYYSQKDIAEIISYAMERNITVIPEIEMPGHARAALSVYPDLACVSKMYSKNEWGVYPDLFCAGKEEVYEFICNVLDEVIALFPSKYIHIGGDEAKKTVWEKCPACQAVMKENGIKTENDLQGFFVSRISDYLSSKGKEVIGWDEILESVNMPNITVMSWRGEEGGEKAAQLGYDAIMAPHIFMYLNYYQSMDKEREPYAQGGYIPIEKVYNYEPVPGKLDSKQAQHIKGVQANLWAEYIHGENKANYMLFPRLLAAAEVAWSPADKDYENFKYRMRNQLQFLDRNNILFRIPEADMEVKEVDSKKFLHIKSSVKGASIIYAIDSDDFENDSVLCKSEELSIELHPSMEKIWYVIQLPSGRQNTPYCYSL